MGWTSYHAIHYKNGKIDRKAECDDYFEGGLNAGHYKIIKSAMCGSVYYAAVKHLLKYAGKDENGESKYEPLPEEDREVFAAIFLTSTDIKDYFNFSYKDMDETMGPVYYDCPKSILDALSETENEYALEWRKKCRERLEKKNSPVSIGKLPVGSVIRFMFGGEMTEVIKHPAAYQFKTPFWFIPSTGKYIPKNRIPDNYEVVRIGS